MYYGNAGAAAPSAAFKQATWSNGYAGVWHMGEASWTTGQASALDSSGNGKNLTVLGTGVNTFAGSLIGRGGDLTPADDGMLQNTSIGPASPNDYTVEAWLYFPSSIWGKMHMGLIRTHDGLWEWNGVGFVQHWNHGVGVRYGYQVAYGLISDPTTPAWHHFAVSVNGAANEAKYYVDGVLKATETPTSGTLWGTQFNIGASRTLEKADEARFNNANRPIEWIQAEYNNQYSPSTFYSLDAELNRDQVAPSNPTVIDGYSTSGKTTPIISGNFYNYPTPYFEWPAAEAVGGAHDTSDYGDPSGVAGYYSYFGTSCGVGGADPALTRGVLSDTGGGLHYSATTNVTVPDLSTNNGTYCLRMKSKDVAGNISSTYEAFAAYKYDTTPPNAPSYIAANPAGYTATNSFSFSWPAVSDQASTPMSGLAGYQYERGAGSGDGWSVTQVGTSVPAITAYKDGENIFLVRSVDNAGNYSSTVQTTYYYSANAPKWSKPTDLTAIPAINDVNSFAFSWTAPSHPQAIVDYGYSINAYPTNLNLTWTGSSSTSLTAGPYATIQGENTFYIIAKDEGGNYALDADNVDSVVFNCQTAAPPIPVSVSVTDSSNRAIDLWALTLKWSAGAGQDPTTFNHYSVLRSTNGVDFSEFATTASTAYIDATGLNNTTTYYYRIKAVDNAGAVSAASGIVSKIPTGKYITPPLTVSGPDVVIKASEATVSWVSSRISTSSIRFGTSEGDLSRSQIDPVAKTSHSITVVGLNPGTKYYYQVQSLDEYRDYSSESAYSSTYSFTTLFAPSIANVSVSNLTLTTADISFETSTPANLALNFGTSASYGNSIAETAGSYTTNHSIKLSNLVHTTRYHFQITGADIDGNALSSDDYVFDTLPMPVISAIQFQLDFSGPAPVMIITWTTNVPTTSSVKYAPASASDVVTFEENQSELVIQHKVSLSNLKDNTEYRLVISGTDQFGNTVTSDEQIFKTKMDTRSPNISDIVIETSNVGLGKTDSVQIAVSWKTDEPATSQVEYDEGLSGDTYTKKTQEDKTLTIAHLVIVSGLKPGSPYHLRVVSADEAQNVANSPDNTVISGAVPKSILQLILQILNQIFGWIGKLL